MTLADLMPFESALKAHDVRAIMPTALDTAGIRSQIGAAVRRKSIISAETMLTDLLDHYKDRVGKIINPVTVTRDGRRVTKGMDFATARLEAKQLLRELGFQPDPEKRGTLKDLSSDQRINLVLKTNVQMMQGAGNFIQGQDAAVLDAFPAQELVRFEGRKAERDWKSRWREAADYSGDNDAARVLDESGRMIARKDSPIWDALGSSDLFPDGLDNPYPPFAFGSGMWVQDVDFETAEKLGLVTLNNVPEPQALDIESLFA